MITVHVDFRYFLYSGGLEDLFNRQKELSIEIPELSVKQLIFHLKDRYLQIKPEFFVTGDQLRPGIIVLINDADWELCGREQYALNNGDKVSFISTLHGG